MLLQPIRSLVVLGLCSTAALAQYPRHVSFAGYDWTVKTSSGRVGPGPNLFSDSGNNVWVDTYGQLHLKITRTGNRWYCAEVILNGSFGHGTYRFYLNTPVDNLDRNVVLGLFTWNDDPDYEHREMDIEFSRWGDAQNLNAQFVVQPYTNPANIWRWNMPSGVPQNTHSFRWSPTSVEFLSVRGLNGQMQPDPSIVLQRRIMTNGIPVPGGENARINLWLFRGNPPSNRQTVEVVINRFEWVP
jgi:hypothetical protein